MILAKEILSSTRRKNKHSGFTMVELIVALTFALIFVTAVLHTISTFGYSVLYSKKNDMKFRKLAEYKLRQINILPSLEDNRKFHVIDLDEGPLISIDELKLGFFIENIPTCLFKSSPVDYLDLKRYDKKGNKSEIDACLWFIGEKPSKKAGEIDFWAEFSAKLTDEHKRVFIRPIFSEKCNFPLKIGINVPSYIKNNTLELAGLMPDGAKNLRSNDIKVVNNWNELSGQKILFNYQNLLVFQNNPCGSSYNRTRLQSRSAQDDHRAGMYVPYSFLHGNNQPRHWAH